MERRFECRDCGSIITTESELDKPIKKCSCGSSNIALLYTAVEDEEMDVARQEIGKAYENITEIIESYMDMPKDQIKMIAIWIIGTYLHSNFPSYPFLYINAMRGSGKTRLLRLISYLSAEGNGEVQTGITESVLFRMPGGKTLILDECESIGSKEKQILREYLNACYKKGGVVQRMKKDKEGNYQPETFWPYKPIALANIWGIDEVLGDRCISFILEKSNDPLKTRKLEDFEDNILIKETTLLLSRFTRKMLFGVVNVVLFPSWNKYITQRALLHNYTNNTKLHNNTKNTEEREEEKESILEREEREEFFNEIFDTEINGRNLELMMPLFAISRHLSKEEFKKVLEFSCELIKEKSRDEFTESRDVLVYEFVANQQQSLEYIPMKELTYRFKVFAGEEEWINEKSLGRSFKRLNLALQKKRVASGSLIMLNVAKAKQKVKIFGSSDEDKKEENETT